LYLTYIGSGETIVRLNCLKIFSLLPKVSLTTHTFFWMNRQFLFDIADYAIGKQFIENVMSVLNGRNLDYIVVNHMEPDHCSLIGELLLHYPDVKIIGNAKTFPTDRTIF